VLRSADGSLEHAGIAWPQRSTFFGVAVVNCKLYTAGALRLRNHFQNQKRPSDAFSSYTTPGDRPLCPPGLFPRSICQGRLGRVGRPSPQRQRSRVPWGVPAEKASGKTNNFPRPPSSLLGVPNPNPDHRTLYLTFLHRMVRNTHLFGACRSPRWIIYPSLRWSVVPTAISISSRRPYPPRDTSLPT